MSRKALIISNPGEVGRENYCDDVFVDVANFKNYLQSPLGGSWEPWEIEAINRPSCSEVRTKVNLMSATNYTMVIFCGHGYTNASTGSTMLELRPNETLDSLDLRFGSIKRTILLDCCRRVHPEDVRKALFESALNFAEPELNRQRCRKAFDDLLSSCNNGLIVGYACSKGEVAGGKPSIGGYYSSSLMRASFSWFDEKKRDLWRINSDQLSIVRTHLNAAQNVSTLSGGTQTVTMEKPRSEPYFPFAVIA